jgi:thiol-disulfide isomerase/thioredoxin
MLWFSRLRATPDSRQFVMLAICLGATITLGCKPGPSHKPGGPTSEMTTSSEEEKQDELKPASGSEVLDRMVIAYCKASRYADKGAVHLVAEAGGQKVIDQTFDFTLAFERPNKIRVQAYEATVVCDGRTLYASIGDLPGQVLKKPAPNRINVKTLYSDRLLAAAMTQGWAGPMPQVALLLADESKKAFVHESVGEPVLSEPGEIDGRKCYRVTVNRSYGPTVFWIDQQNFILRRVVLPTDDIRQSLSDQQPVDRVSLVAEFPGAQIDGRIDPKAFQFEVPQGAEIVKFFVPPNTAQLLSKKVPDFKFFDPAGKPFTPESLAGKVAVLDFWATYCGPCRQTLPALDKVYQQYKANPKVAFYAVSVDAPKMKNEEVAKVLAQWKVGVPMLRDAEQSAMALKFTGIPTTFLIGADGVVQDCQQGGNPKFIDELPDKITKLLAGQNVYDKPLKEYQDQLNRYAKMLESSPEGEPVSREPVVKEMKLPEPKIAPRSKPATMKLASLWKCSDVKSPGNMLVLSQKQGPSRLLVVETWKSLAEVGLDGKVIARHELKIDENEVIGNLRSAVGTDGRRYTVAFMATQQRCHVLDENWKLVVSYPEDALKKPHSGLSDVELGDLDGDGKLKMYVGYLGIVGVQAVSLDGKRIWANRSLSNVGGIAIGPPEADGRRNLLCTTSNGPLVVLDSQSQRKGEIRVRNHVLHWIVGADLRGDGQLEWCGMASSSRLGENVAVGFSLKGAERWRYAMPPGGPPPMELIVPGSLTRQGPGQWILPGPDGSIHVISADGKPLDKFNSGVILQGLATVEIDGRPAIVISSPEGIEAWKVE